MKSKLQLLTLAASLFLILSLGAAFAQNNPGTMPVNPTMGLPSPPTIDPATGLPLAQSVEWKDSNWKDPDTVLTDVSYDYKPLSEVAKNLREQFKEQFDLILPLHQPMPATWDIDWGSILIQLRLKNVTASEVFNAMNLLFETDRTPLRWELRVNGHRQVVLLRMLGERNPQYEEVRRVYFIGDLIGKDDGGMTVEQIINTLDEIWKMTDYRGSDIKYYKDAQLLIVFGNRSQVEYIEQTLVALRQKVNHDRTLKSQPNSAESKPASEESKTCGSAGSK
jgi:hypothetical protein